MKISLCDVALTTLWNSFWTGVFSNAGFDPSAKNFFQVLVRKSYPHNLTFQWHLAEHVVYSISSIGPILIPPKRYKDKSSQYYWLDLSLYLFGGIKIWKANLYFLVYRMEHWSWNWSLLYQKLPDISFFIAGCYRIFSFKILKV